MTDAELRALIAKATPGPWRWNVHATSKRAQIEGGIPRFDLTVVDFVRWGMGGAAPRFRDEDRPGLNIMHRCDEHLTKVPGREHHFEWFADIDHPDAQLIVAAVNALPGLLDRLAAAEADAARYRWLRDHVWNFEVTNRGVKLENRTEHITDSLSRKDMDAAIDAAREAGK